MGVDRLQQAVQLIRGQHVRADLVDASWPFARDVTRTLTSGRPNRLDNGARRCAAASAGQHLRGRTSSDRADHARFEQKWPPATLVDGASPSQAPAGCHRASSTGSSSPVTRWCARRTCRRVCIPGGHAVRHRVRRLRLRVASVTDSPRAPTPKKRNRHRPRAG